MTLRTPIFEITIFSIFLSLLLSASLTVGQNQLLSKIDHSDHPKSKTTVIVFLGIDCPISQKYLVRLNNINTKYSTSEVKMIGIIPGKKKEKELDAFAHDYDVKFPIRADKHHYFSNTLHAEITPEVFLFDSTGNLKYQGAIDNWYYELGRYRQGESENYLLEAIESVLNGIDPKIKKTKAVGCLIEN